MSEPMKAKESFLDKGTIAAIVAIALLWWGWSVWFERTYAPKAAQSAQVSDAAATDGAASKADATASSGSVAPSGKAAAELNPAVGDVKAKAMVAQPVRTETLDLEAVSGTLSSNGFGLSQLLIKNFRNRDESPIRIGAADSASLMTVSLLVGAEQIEVPFAIEKTETGFRGTAQVGPISVVREIDPVGPAGDKAKTKTQSGQSFRSKTKISGDLSALKAVVFNLTDEVAPPQKGSLFAPSYDYYDWFLNSAEEQSRLIVDAEKFAPVQKTNMRSLALSSHYFTFAVADNSPVRPELQVFGLETIGTNLKTRSTLTYPVLAKTDQFEVDQTFYVGAKDVDLLRGADQSLEKVVDYGFFAVFAEPLLWLMRFFFSLVGNWGLAIIGMTLVVRLAVLPLNISSMKSMKAMQKIQPQMQAVREKYKQDPRRQNEEVMKLMKENNANPIGGCLPMLLQLPVFFALYQVLGQSVELYRQPFFWWIQDLTSKDPYYVLPILLGAAMFAHQKITPVADPQQAKILMIVPVIMTVSMLALPSGLTLYILLSTVFGVGQQLVLMRDKKDSSTEKSAQVVKV